MKLITNFHATPRLRISGVLPTPPKTSSWHDFQAGMGTVLLSYMVGLFWKYYDLSSIKVDLR
jgi:hypothetical protein